MWSNHPMRSGVARLTCLLAGAFLAATALPAEALARAGSGSSSFGRSLGHNSGYRTSGSGGHLCFFGGGGVLQRQGPRRWPGPFVWPLAECG
jgi:hypothetical protein